MPSAPARDTPAGSSPAARAPFLSLFTFPRPTQACAPPASLLPARRWVRRRRHGRAVVARPRAQLFLSSPFFLSDARRRRNGDLRGGRRRNGGAAAGPLAGECVHQRVSAPPSSGSASVPCPTRARQGVPSSTAVRVLTHATALVRRQAGASGGCPVRQRPAVAPMVRP